ncbi:MAG: hypothetical protein FalmKO_35070 [Falsiruegeria mediterranea]|jgi:hypothetical protein
MALQAITELSQELGINPKTVAKLPKRQCRLDVSSSRHDRTIKGATGKRYDIDNHLRLRWHLADVLSANNRARRLKSLNRPIPCECIRKTRTPEPERIIPHPIHQIPRANA